MSDNNPRELFVAAAALVISVVALSATLLQVAQQYYASAAGYSNCNRKVIGQWAETKKRRFRWAELRFEVQFEAPVIFLCAPNNTKGPLPDQQIYFLTGEKQSLDDTWTTLKDKRQEEEDQTDKERIQTADNERATWVTLLNALQRLEKESRDWQQAEYKNLPPPHLGPVPEPPSLASDHTLTVALQRKRRTWDTMPSNVKKPYATTTMCHLIEMLAVLNIYWVEFDRSHNRYRAEGNGYIVTGEYVIDLGLMFSFQIYGKNEFKRNRVIPVDEVKELCFGVVPTIYRETLDPRKLQSPSDEPRGISALQLGGDDQIAETLIAIGCNTNTVNFFSKDRPFHSHLFPIAFEILGMLGRTLHIEGSCFRMLPNPTVYRWDRKSFSLRDMLSSYEALFWVDLPGMPRNQLIKGKIKYHISRLQEHMNQLLPKNPYYEDFKLPLLDHLHKVLDDMDEILTAKKKQPKQPKNANGNANDERPQANHQRHASGAVNLQTTTETERERARREMVQDVLRSHIQEVVLLLNEHDDDNIDSASPTTPAREPQLRAIDAAAPEDKQAEFMRVYFNVVRTSVVGKAKNSTGRRGSVLPGATPTQGIKRSETEKSIAEEPVASLTLDTYSAAETDGSAAGTEDEKTGPNLAGLNDVYHDDIWCILVFRMICWLMLHDFHKKDVQQPKSELLGSRLPVYIA